MNSTSQKPKRNKVKRLEIRLTEEELDFLKQKAEGYPSLSSFILDSVKSHDSRRGRNRIDTMIRFSDLMDKSDADLSRIGNNINQIAHAFNRQLRVSLDAKLVIEEQFLELVFETKTLLQTMILEFRKLSNSDGLGR